VSVPDLRRRQNQRRGHRGNADEAMMTRGMVCVTPLGTSEGKKGKMIFYPGIRKGFAPVFFSYRTGSHKKHGAGQKGTSSLPMRHARGKKKKKMGSRVLSRRISQRRGEIPREKEGLASRCRRSNGKGGGPATRTCHLAPRRQGKQWRTSRRREKGKLVVDHPSLETGNTSAFECPRSLMVWLAGRPGPG